MDVINLYQLLSIFVIGENEIQFKVIDNVGNIDITKNVKNFFNENGYFSNVEYARLILSRYEIMRLEMYDLETLGIIVERVTGEA